jgi:hypothetical protein
VGQWWLKLESLEYDALFWLFYWEKEEKCAALIGFAF